METLTPENYYQDKERLSTSRLKRYMECEAKALAIDKGEWEDGLPQTALLVGNYVHSYFESDEAHQAFLDENKDSILTKKGELKKDFKIAEKVIKTLDSDPEFLLRYNGSENDKVFKEYILDEKLYGVPFKGKLDSLNLSKGYFIDLKTMRSIYDKKYSEKLGVSVPTIVYNIFEYGYHIQTYVYQQLLMLQELDFFTPYIIAVSKEDVPDKKLVRIDNEVLQQGKIELESVILRVADVALGGAKPKPCGHCDYCKAHQFLNSEPVLLAELIMQN